MLKIRSFLAKVALISYSLCIFVPNLSYAKDCGPCYYKDAFGKCLKKGGCIVKNLNPVEQGKRILSVAKAIKTGDAAAIRESLGDLLINSPNCSTCSTIARNIAPKLSEQQIKQAVGEGFLVFLATGDPVLVVVDVANNVVSQQSIKNSDTAPAPPQQPGTNREAKIYSGVAECIVEYKNGYMYAGWKNPPQLIGSDGKRFTVPEIDLRDGDVINLTARSCDGMNNEATGQKSIPTASIKYVDQKTLNGDSNVIKWWLHGPHY